jgi:hypothetical protein
MTPTRRRFHDLRLDCLLNPIKRFPEITTRWVRAGGRVGLRRCTWMVRVAVRTADAAFFSGEFVTAKHYANDGRMGHFLTSSASASGIGIKSPLPESSDQAHLESYFNTINRRRARSLAPASSVAPLTALSGQCALHHFFERG